MSNFAAAMTAIGNDPQLQARVMAANSAQERQVILSEAGIALPTHADVNAHHANLAAASGAGSSTGTVGGTRMSGGEIGAAASGAAAGAAAA